MYVLFVILLSPVLIPALYMFLKDEVNRQNGWGKYKKRGRRRRR